MLRAAEVESFSAFEFLDHARARARTIALIAAGAGVVALAVSLLIPKQYTATASVLIDPPSTVIASPVYFESLRAYESLAASDSLFARAVEKFHLRDDGSPAIETLKRRVLRVTKLRDTKILEITVTLHDPRQAQAMAQFLAEQTVTLNRESNEQNDRELIAQAQSRMEDARKRLESAQAAWREFSMKQPVENLRSDLEALSIAREELDRDLVEARTNDLGSRVASLEKQEAELTRRIDATAAQIAARDSRTDELQRAIKEAQADFDGAAAHARDLESARGLRGERLRVVDPGVVPERASSPLTGWNVALTILASLLVSFVYLALTFRPR